MIASNVISINLFALLLRGDLLVSVNANHSPKANIQEKPEAVIKYFEYSESLKDTMDIIRTETSITKRVLNNSTVSEYKDISFTKPLRNILCWRFDRQPAIKTYKFFDVKVEAENLVHFFYADTIKPAIWDNKEKTLLHDECQVNSFNIQHDASLNVPPNTEVTVSLQMPVYMGISTFNATGFCDPPATVSPDKDDENEPSVGGNTPENDGRVESRITGTFILKQVYGASKVVYNYNKLKN